MLAAFDMPDEAFDAHADEDRPTNDDGGSPGLGPSVRLIFSLLEQWPVFPVCCVVSSLQSRRVVDGGRRQRAREQRCARDLTCRAAFVLRIKLFRGLYRF